MIGAGVSAAPGPAAAAAGTWLRAMVHRAFEGLFRHDLSRTVEVAVVEQPSGVGKLFRSGVRP